MSRPIRDEPVRLPQRGDALRAVGRYSDGYEWISRGTNELLRAGAAWTEVIAERVRRQDALADAAALTRAKADMRLRTDERLRALDARAPDFNDRAASVVAEEIQRAVEQAPLVRSGSRDRLAADMEPMRAQLLMAQAERRERAVIDDARLQARSAINASVAAVATGTNPELVLLEAEATLAPILTAVDPQVRDEIVHAARTSIASEAVKALVDRRDFRGAQALLEAYRTQGVITPDAARTVRVGMEREQRAAEAEARLEQRLHEADLRDAVHGARSAEDAQRELDEAVRTGRVRPGAPVVQTLQRHINTARRAAVDQRGRAVGEAEELMRFGVSLTPQQQAAYVAASVGIAAERAEREARQAGMEVTEEVRQAAVSAARDRAVLTLIRADPSALPAVVEREAARIMHAGSIDDRAAFAAWLYESARGADGSLPPAAMKALEADPYTHEAVAALLRAQEPVTPEAVRVGLMLDRSTPETRAARQVQWAQAISGRTPAVVPREAMEAALARAAPNVSVWSETALAVGTAAMERAFVRGASPEQAAALAAQTVLTRYPANPLATAPGDARMDARLNPMNAIPRGLIEQYGVNLVTEAMREHLTDQLHAALRRKNEAAPGATPLSLNDVDMIPVAIEREGRPRGIGLMMRVRRDPTGQARMVRDSAGNPWVFDTADEEALSGVLGLEARANVAVHDHVRNAVVLYPIRGRTDSIITIISPALNEGRPTNVFRERDGRPISQDEAVRRALISRDPLPSFRTVEDARAAAIREINAREAATRGGR